MKRLIVLSLFTFLSLASGRGLGIESAARLPPPDSGTHLMSLLLLAQAATRTPGDASAGLPTGVVADQEIGATLRGTALLDAPHRNRWVKLAQTGVAIMSPLPELPPVHRKKGKPAPASPRRAGEHVGPPDYSPGVYVVARRGRRLAYLKGILAGVPLHVVQADLRDAEIKIGVTMAQTGIGGSESFPSMLRRTGPAAAITGTFFGLRNGLPTGDIVVNGRAIYRGFIGTALAITDGNVVSFISCGYKEEQNWSMFDTVIRGGPRLVLAGEIAVNPGEEGFRTLAGDACHARTAVGITRDRKLLLVAVKAGVTLHRLALAMRALGAYHAVALDGGTSTALSFGGRVIAQPARALTNMLVVYADRGHYERARSHFYYRARRRVLPSGPPDLSVKPEAPPPAETADPPAIRPPATSAPEIPFTLGTPTSAPDGNGPKMPDPF